MGADDPNAALLARARVVPRWSVNEHTEPELPLLLRRGRGSRTSAATVCAAYTATCIGATMPPRATLTLASGEGGLGLGTPTDSGGWRLRSHDFCKGPPSELAPPVRRFPALPDDVPKPEHCFCPTNPLEQRFADPLGFSRQMPAGAHPKLPRLPHSTRCARGRSYVTYQCSRYLLLPPPRSSDSSGPGVDVLLATSDHFGHGLFAMVQRVLNQIHLALEHGLEPAVFLGEHTFMEPQACEYGTNPYFYAPMGDNVWDYWFRQPGSYALGARLAGGRPVDSLQVVTVEAMSDTPIRAYGTLEQRMRGWRAAHALLGTNGSKLVKPVLLDAARRIFAPWRARSRHIIGVHLRGTDKVVRPKVPPEAYFPLLDAYLAAHDDALILLATDDRRYADRLGARYPFGTRVVSRGRGYSSASWGGSADPVDELRLGGGMRGSRPSGYHKGVHVLLDALLLSLCDFMLLSASAVAEFALWISPHLWPRHLDLQATDRFKQQTMPAWTEHVHGATRARRRPAVAEAYCTALEAACANDTRRLTLGDWSYRLYGGRHCNKCDPPQRRRSGASG